MAFTKLKPKKIPKLKIHNYVVRFITDNEKSYDETYFYCRTYKEAMTARKKAKPGDIIEIFKAEHSFKEAWK